MFGVRTVCDGYNLVGEFIVRIRSTNVYQGVLMLWELFWSTIYFLLLQFVVSSIFQNFREFLIFVCLRSFGIVFHCVSLTHSRAILRILTIFEKIHNFESLNSNGNRLIFCKNQWYYQNSTAQTFGCYLCCFLFTLLCYDKVAPDFKKKWNMHGFLCTLYLFLFFGNITWFYGNFVPEFCCYGCVCCF